MGSFFFSTLGPQIRQYPVLRPTVFSVVITWIGASTVVYGYQTETTYRKTVTRSLQDTYMIRLELIALSLSLRRRYALDQLSHVGIPEECLLRPPTLRDLHGKATQVLDGRVERWRQRLEHRAHDSVCRTEDGTTLVEAVLGILLRSEKVCRAVYVSRHICAL